jgi:hypothetical protein
MLVQAKGYVPLFEPREELYGYMLMLVSVVNAGASGLLGHLLGAPAFGLNVAPAIVMWVQGVTLVIGASVCILLFVDYRAYVNGMSSRTFTLLVLRGLLGALGALSFLTALSLLPFGDASTLLFLVGPNPRRAPCHSNKSRS